MRPPAGRRPAPRPPDRRRSLASLSTIAVTVAVAGVAAASILTGPGGPRGGRDRTEQPPPTTDTPVPTAPALGGLENLPGARPGQFRGRLVMSDRARCRLVVLDLATLERTPVPGAPEFCVLTASPRGRFAALETAAPLIVDVRGGGPRLDTGLLARTSADPAPAVADDGTVAACVGGRLLVAPPGDSARPRPGCHPAFAGRRLLRVVAGDRLRIVDERGRALPLRGRGVAQALPPYLLAASPDGRFVAVRSLDSATGTNVAAFAVDDGRLVGRRSLPSLEDPVDVRLASGGEAVALRVVAQQSFGWRLLRLTGAAVREDAIGEDAIRDASFSPDGRWVVVVTERFRLLVLDARTFGPVASLPVDETLRAFWVPAESR